MIRKLLFVCLLFFISIRVSFGQATCNGSLGDPLVNITFGQGSNPGAPLSTVVPGASTNYNYVAPGGNPPPNVVLDGDYAIINATASNFFWLQTGDHTNNGNGYMAFFNAAPNPGEFYRQQVSGLCSGTTYEFAAWIMNALDNSKAANTVPPNVTFKIFNPTNLVTPLVSFSTGDILPTSTVIWRQYATLFSTPAGINSVILTLSNNNIGGSNSFGNDLAIDDITFRACGPLTTASFASATALNSLSVCGSVPFNLYGKVSAGLNNPAYQWQISTDNGNSFTNIVNATQLNYAATGLPFGNYKFRLISQETANISSPFCKFFSNVIDLSVIPFVVDAGADTSFCSDNTVLRTLHASGGSTYSWSPASFLNDATIASPTATLTTTTKFYVTVSNNSGCSNIDSVTVFVNPFPALISSGNSVICADSTLKLSVSGANSFSWTPPNLVSDPGIANPNFTGTQSSVIYVTGTSNGCSKVDTLNIVVKPLPQIKTIADTTICKAQSITLTTSGASAYSWFPGFQLDDPNIASPVFKGNRSQKYFVKGFEAGCSNLDSVSVIIHDQDPFLQPPNKATCLNKSVILEGFNGSESAYHWSPSITLDDANKINPVASPGVTTNYSVTVSDRYCIVDTTFKVLLTVLPLPNVKASKSNDLDCTSTSTQLSATGATTYSWLPAGSLNNPNSPAPTAKPQTVTTYIVMGTDVNGCKNSDSVQVLKSNNNNELFIANSFTPNNDGINDCFRISVPGILDNIEFNIYNRWGENVFSANNTGSCWNGKYKNTESPAGTYVYSLKANTACGMIVKKGYVLLIR